MSDITFQFGFVDVVDEDGLSNKEPALGIKPAKLGRVPIFAIPISSAWAYYEPDYLMKACFDIATFLNMFPDQFLINRIADTITNNIPDLIKQKPFIAGQGKECGEGKLTLGGDQIINFGITDTGGVLK
jgi:hypothetical protein